MILPVVPLGIESRCSFRIINDGYQSLSLKYSQPDISGGIPIQLIFPEGNNLGINNNKIKVDVVFVAKKAISFTTKIEFEDENKRYPILISGTADNCI